MKKNLFVLIFALVINSCSKDDSTPSSNIKYCYEFTTQITTSISPPSQGYPQTTSSRISECDLTEQSAIAIADSLTQTTTQHISGFTITTKESTTYKRK